MKQKGFTFIELLVIISVVFLLLSIVGTALNDAKVKKRDMARENNLIQIRKALELYYQANSHYPISECFGTANQWVSFDSQLYSSNKICNKINEGGTKTLAEEMAPFISNIKDPVLNVMSSGYNYKSLDGQEYCLMAYLTPENMNNFNSEIIEWNKCLSILGKSCTGENAIFVGNIQVCK